MNPPRPARHELRPRPLDILGIVAVLSIPFVLAAVPTPVAVAIAIIVGLALTIAYFATGRRG